MMSVVENFNDYEEEVTETTIRNLLGIQLDDSLSSPL